VADLQKLGRYELRRVLGRGAMGVVYEGFDPTLGRRVAVKTILKNAAVDEETAAAYSAQFAREAQAAGRLNHPNIVHVHDFAEQGEVAYLVMEYIQGKELRSFFDAGEKFDAAEVVRIMGELLDALHFAHEANVIHRDIKPANIMLDAQRRVKLADFGVARIQDSERSAAGTMVGTPAFMSPEQIQGLKIDRRTDIFSAGVILYQLLTGDQPFTGQGAWTVAKKIMQDEPPPPSTVVKSISPAYDAIVNRALAKDPAQRFANAQDFAAALRSTLGGVPPQAVAAAAAPAPKAKPQSQASEAEVEFWRSIQNTTDPSELQFYLEQFPEGTYASLARHKMARLTEQQQGEDKAKQAEDQARRAVEQQAEEKARREAEEKARAVAAEQARKQAEEQARRAEQEKAAREAQEKARREMQERARRDAQEKAKREQEEKARQAQAQPRPRAEPAPPPAPEQESQPKSYLIPSIAGVLVVAAAVGAFLFFSKKPAPEPVAAAPVAAPVPAAPAKAEVSAADIEKIRKETEERIRKEYADKSASEQVAAAKAATEKAIQDKQSAAKAATEKATADKLAAEKAAAEKAVAAARSASERAAAEKALAEKQAAEKAAAEKIAAEKAAADKAAAEKAAADKLAAEKTAAEKAAAEKQVAAAAPSHEALLERFTQRKGAATVMRNEPPESTSAHFNPYPQGTLLYVNDGSCPRGQIKQVTWGNNFRNVPRLYACWSMVDDRATSDKPGGGRPVAAAAPTAAAGSGDDQALQRFIQKVGADKVVQKEPPRVAGALMSMQVVYVNDGSCAQGYIKEVVGGNAQRGQPRTYRCIRLE
jgi:serine/threonine protein kinase